MPERFDDVSESLVCRCIDEFVKICKVHGADRAAYRITHATLCTACRFNRMRVARHLLEQGLCDPSCRFLSPVECRPLHIATSCGYGHLSQLLINHGADPAEVDERGEAPIFKLTRSHLKQIDLLKATVRELEAKLGLPASGNVSVSVSPVVSKSQAGSPSRREESRLDSVMLSSRI